MVPEILSVTDRIFCHFGQFFLHLPPKNLKNQNFEKNIKCLEILFYTSASKIRIICYTVPEIWHVTDVIVIFQLDYFLPFYPPNSLKSENFKKMKKAPGDVIILHKCTKNYQCSSQRVIPCQVNQSPQVTISDFLETFFINSYQ